MLYLHNILKFQFLLVRLKEKEIAKIKNDCGISIPTGTIKSLTTVMI